MTTTEPNYDLRIDGLEYSIWTRERFLEWREGGLDAVHVTLAIWETARETLGVVGQWQRHFRENSDLIMQVRTPADIIEARDSGRTGVILGLQNTTPFEDDLDLVGAFYAAGIRIAQLTYNIQNSAGSGCWEENDSGVSSHYGRHLIREMNRVGMLVDISHCGEQTCFDAIEVSELPIALTHGNPREFVGDDVELAMRNRSTKLITTLAEVGGVIGLSMYPRIAPGGNECTLKRFCEMADWTASLIGVQHVAIGTDLYLGHEPDVLNWWRMGRWSRELAVPISGLPVFPEWMRTPAQFSGIKHGLLEQGFSEAECSAILGGNFMRLFEKVLDAR